MFRVSAPLLSRQWTPKQIRYFKKQKLVQTAAKQRRKASRPKYMPNWTRHDIWLEEPQATKTIKASTTQTTAQIPQPQKTQTTQNATTDSQVSPQTQQVSNPPPPEVKKVEKKSRFKFW